MSFGFVIHLEVPQSAYDKITCLDMAEHVGVRYFGTFPRQVYDMLDDDDVSLFQIAGIRKSWQYEDLIWGLFMNKYIIVEGQSHTPTTREGLCGVLLALT